MSQQVLKRTAGLLVAIVVACSQTPEPQWPLPCQFTLEESIDKIARCASRGPGGEITVRPAVVAERVAAGTIYAPQSGVVYQAVVDGKRFFVLSSGKTAPTVSGYDTTFFDEGLARTERSGKVGFLNENLVEVIPPTWDFALPFKSGLAVVCNGCKPKAFGEAVMRVGGTWGYIDATGRVVVPIEYSKQELPSRAQVNRDGVMEGEQDGIN